MAMAGVQSLSVAAGSNDTENDYNDIQTDFRFSAFKRQASIILPRQKAEAEHTGSSKYSTPEERFEGIINFLEGQSGLDVFQILAFRIRSGNGCCQNDSCWGYNTDKFKCILSVFTQGITQYMLLNETLTNSEDKEWCNIEDYESYTANDIGFKVMVTCYSLVLATSLYAQLDAVLDAGFYLYLDYENKDYKWISSNILHFGRIWNMLTLVLTFAQSFLIIFFSDSVLDIILNSVALLFIVDIDNIMVDSDDYEKIRQWFYEIKEKNIINQAFDTKPNKSVARKTIYAIYIFLAMISFFLIFLTPIVAIAVGVCH